jgi:hypothetical protein
MRRLTGVGMLLLVMAGTAWGDQSRITHFTREARRLAQQPGADGIPAQLGTFRAWIAEAQAAQIAKKTRTVERALARIEAQHQLIVALLDKVVAKRAAQAAKAEAREMRAAASAAHAEVARREEARRRLAASLEEAP